MQRILNTGNPILQERPTSAVHRNHFDWSHSRRLSCNIGKLVPMTIFEVLPNTRVSITPELLGRLQPMIFPVMDNLTIRTEWFYIPARILWVNWEVFYAGTSAEAGVAPAMPFFGNLPVELGSTANHLGLPATPSCPGKVTALPFYAFFKVTCDWYNDNNINPTFEFFPADDGNNNTHSGVVFAGGAENLPNRNYDRDYFTSALPWAQKGDAVLIPVIGTGAGDNIPVSVLQGIQGQIDKSVDGTPAPAGSLSVSGTGALEASGPVDAVYDPNGSLVVNSIDFLELAGTIEDLRTARALQMFLEADGFAGTGAEQYAANLQMHWGVYNHDSRVQRAEYLGMTKQRFGISEVLNTTGTADAPQGAMAGHGISAARHPGTVDYTATEQGYIIGVVSVIPDTSYYQGVPKMFDRFDRLDFPFPEFAELGAQEIKNQELFYDSTSGDNDSVWGYLPRYSEMRFIQSRVTGDFAGSLDAWTMARKFDSLPPLDNIFITVAQNEALDRIFAVIDPVQDHVLISAHFTIHCEQPLPRVVRPAF